LLVIHPVPVGGVRSHGHAFARKPRPSQEVSDCHGPLSSRESGWLDFADKPLSELLGVSTVVAGGVPPSPFLAADGVDAVVVDDVEEVSALHDVGHPAILIH